MFSRVLPSFSDQIRREEEGTSLLQSGAPGHLLSLSICLSVASKLSREVAG